MSQQFQRDVQANSATVNVPTTTETTILTTNSLPVPYQNAKAAVFGTIVLTPGTTTNLITLKVRRNPAAENLVVNTIVYAAGFTVGSAGELSFGATDPIPDGRSVQYAVTVTQGAATANGTAQVGCYIDATLLSG